MSKDKEKSKPSVTRTGILVPVQVVYNPHTDKWIAETFDHHRKGTYSQKGRTPAKAVKKLMKMLEEQNFRWFKQAPYAGKLIASGIVEHDDEPARTKCKQESFDGDIESRESVKVEEFAVHYGTPVESIGKTISGAVTNA